MRKIVGQWLTIYGLQNQNADFKRLFCFAVRSVLIAAMCLQIAKLCKLAQVAFGRSSVEAKVTDNLFCGNFIFFDHILQNIDHFLCQGRFYRPFIDHFLS